MCTAPADDQYSDNEYYCAMKIILDEVFANTTCKVSCQSSTTITIAQGGARSLMRARLPL